MEAEADSPPPERAAAAQHTTQTNAPRDGRIDPLRNALDTVRTMVREGGCAWHGVQTHGSLTPFLIEESAEFIDAVERGLPAEEVRGELGDVLYQVLFHAAIAERDGEGYDLDSVAEALNAKLIARHPHVFGGRGQMSVEELHAEWERLKEDAAGEQRGSRGALDGIPVGMPTLARTAKVVERLKRAGLVEATEEGTPAEAAPKDVEAALGDAMLALVMRANAAGVDPDRALRLATNRLTHQLAG